LSDGWLGYAINFVTIILWFMTSFLELELCQS
jgi:hypothetical protein